MRDFSYSILARWLIWAFVDPTNAVAPVAKAYAEWCL